MRRSRLIISMAVAVSMLTAALLAATTGAASAANAGTVGAFDNPISAGHIFDAAPPATVTDSLRFPTAVSVVALPKTGGVAYWNGLQDLESDPWPLATDASRISGHGSQARLVPGSVPLGTLDLSSPIATTPDNGGSSDLFCADLRILLDGSVLAAGGTDWRGGPVTINNDPNDPTLPQGTSELFGAKAARILSDQGNWTQAQSMANGRWYPALVTLPNGKLFVAGGVGRLLYNAPVAAPGNEPAGTGTNVANTETFDPYVGGAYKPALGSWSINGAVDPTTGAHSGDVTLPLFARLHLISNGNVYYDGDGQMWGPFGQGYDQALWNVTKMYNPTSKSWTDVGVGNYGALNGAASVLLPYDLTAGDPNGTSVSSSILHAGGTLGTSPGTYLATDESEVLTVAQDGSLTKATKGSLNNKRWYSSSVLGPDGKAYVFSGADKDEVVLPGTEVAVHQAESYDPATGQWTGLASATRDRTYHNSAILLADGTILTGGHSPINTGYGPGNSATGNTNYLHDGGAGTANNLKDPSFQVFRPPYLFDASGAPAVRPTISGISGNLDWGSDRQIAVTGSTSSSDIGKVVLIHMPASTHTTDADGREINLSFTTNPGGVKAHIPTNSAVAPPGWYYLFAINKAGVPSVADIVRVGDSTVLNGAGAFVPPPVPQSAPAKSAPKTANVVVPVAAAPIASAPMTSRSARRTSTMPITLALSAMALAVLAIGTRKKARVRA